MLCLVESHDVLGFINGEILEPQSSSSNVESEEQKLWRRTDRLVQGWILGSIGKDALDTVWNLETAREVWLELEKIFNDEAEKSEIQSERDANSAQEEGGGSEDLSRYLPLLLAALRGDWETAKTNFFDIDEEEAKACISSGSSTALHYAVLTGKATDNDFVKKLVELMPHDALALKDCYGNTALHKAAVVGNTEAARTLVNKNPDLPYNLNEDNRLPVIQAAIYCRKETLECLISVSLPNVENKYSCSFQIISTVTQKMEFVLWKVIQHLVPQVKGIRDKKAVHQQALKLVKCLCQKMVSLPEKEVSSMFRNTITKAAKYGISEIVEVIMEMYPHAIYANDDDTGMGIFLLAASYRFENVFNLIYRLCDIKYELSDDEDKEDNNLLHICGKLAPPDRLNLVRGAALQMQRELQWFKEMEKFVHPSRRIWTNNKGKTPKMIFTEEHQQLKAEGERWMKDTANACTIATALIATVVFAAAFTVPGGIVAETGLPIFSKEFAFILFAIADAVSLFTSITSLLMFLSILTSRYAEEDFLYVLPKRLSMGLLSLFVSIIFMMIAFSATLYLVFHRKVVWFLMPVAALACLPVTSFVLLQFPLLVDVLYSTYGPGIFGKKSARLLY